MPQILVVDDNKELRSLFCLMLKEFELYEAGNGLEAISVCQENKVDLILMDILMPEMDGIDATKEILKIHPDMLIVGITAYSNRAEEMMKVGAKEILIKPIRKNQLISKVKEYVK